MNRFAVIVENRRRHAGRISGRGEGGRLGRLDDDVIVRLFGAGLLNGLTELDIQVILVQGRHTCDSGRGGIGVSAKGIGWVVVTTAADDNYGCNQNGR